jgi:hypothetical protein
MIVSILAWIGSGALCIAPFFIDTASGKLLAVFGLSILIPQTIQKRAFNLTVLNCVGIIGYLWELFT